MELEAIKRIDRNQKVYMPGDSLTIKDQAECKRLIALGAAKAKAKAKSKIVVKTAAVGPTEALKKGKNA